jgi:two-component system cell cycle response regulator
MSQTVLVIDDSYDTHALLDARFALEGLALRHCLDACEGLAAARALQPDLILLDVDMPGVTGFDVCQRLKADTTTAEMPVIFLTGSTDTDTKVRGFDLGAIDYVTKPFDAAELRARVRAALRTKRDHDLLTHRAYLDSLTGLYRRAYFDRRLAEEVAAARRYGRRVTLLRVDLEPSERLDDRVIERVGEIVLGSVRAVDVACRSGSQELSLILPEVGVDGGVVVAQRIQERLGRLQIERRRVAVSASYGVASSERFGYPTAMSPDGLLAAAESALSASKRQGRDLILCAW